MISYLLKEKLLRKNNNLLYLLLVSIIVVILLSGCINTKLTVKETDTKEQKITQETIREETKEKTVITKGKILFTSERDGNYQIYVMNADGSELKNLSNNQAGDLSSVYSPDGKKILFTSMRNGRGYELYIMNSDGTEQKRLAKGPDFSINWGPSYNWSPDGKKIVFTSWVGDHKGNEEIYIMNADGTDQKRLTNSPGNDGGPKCSPDGKKIMFISERDGNSEIYVMNADGLEQTNLTNNPADEYHYEWSPDGKRIVFVRRIDYYDKNNRYKSNHEIYIMNADGTDQRRLTDNPLDDSFPHFSPDGTKIVFESVTVYDEENEISTSDIFVMNIDDSKLTNLTNTPDKSEFRPIWSPDGTKIAFGCMDKDENYEVYVMNSNGSGRINLTNNLARDWIGCWKP